eukprot:TRINITY_DN7858_c0_g5_i1.p1 TRINITY_DN7858_c0_g5~~TRINITY_DN7858_c0_g5_i1.p1  ORF type:complete len:547 (-),score=113.20 TRINITY_DN7858_c0_g5_i1:53-1693(-)
MGNSKIKMSVYGMSNNTKQVHRKEIQEILTETRKLFWKNQEKLMEIERHRTIEKDIQRLSHKNDQFMATLNFDEEALAKMETSQLFNLKVKLLSVFDKLENERIEIDRLSMKSAFLNEAKSGCQRKKKQPVTKKLNLPEIRHVEGEESPIRRRPSEAHTTLQTTMSPLISPRIATDRGPHKLSLDLIELSSRSPPRNEKVEDQYERLAQMLTQLKEFSETVVTDVQDTQRMLEVATAKEEAAHVCPHCNKEIVVISIDREVKISAKSQMDLLERTQMELEDVYSSLLRGPSESERQKTSHQNIIEKSKSLKDITDTTSQKAKIYTFSIENDEIGILKGYIHQLQERLVDHVETERRIVDELRKELHQQELMNKSLLHEKNRLEVELNHQIALSTQTKTDQEKSQQSNAALRTELLEMSASINEHYTKLLRLCEYNELFGIRSSASKESEASANKYEKINKRLIALQRIWENEENRAPEGRLKSPSRSMSKSQSTRILPETRLSGDTFLSPAKPRVSGSLLSKFQLDLPFDSIKDCLLYTSPSPRDS